MNDMQKIYQYIFLIFALAYVVTIPIQPYPGHFVVKAIPILSLAILALTKVKRLRGKLLFVALLFSAAGDITLSLEAGKYFVIGLGFFLIAQIVYIVTSSRDFKFQKTRIPIAAILVVYALAIAIVLTPALKEMALPVYLYLTVITTMGIFAAFRASRNKLVLYGALLFIASDSMIAINKFLTPVPASDYLIMGTYYLAQFSIVYGFLKDSAKQI
jgi:alkenylglycerophosphocholine/alkenylglycerophosphoethanolamine hydrolase